jgi:molybdopterin molybdotransferase
VRDWLVNSPAATQALLSLVDRPDLRRNGVARVGSMTAGSPSISADEHLADVLATIRTMPARTVSLEDAAGRVLAADVLALTDVPPFDNSSMDGYAVRRHDLAGADNAHPVALEVVADLAADTGDNPPLGRGEAARIMTGAPTPDAADAIVPLEDTDRGTTTVLIRTEPAPAAFIRRAGSDTRAGDVVLRAGARLTSRHLAAAAASGSASLSVHPAPRVGVLSTGSELAEPGSALRRGQIHDSNSVLLAAMVAEAGGEPVLLGRVDDDEDRFGHIIADTAGDVDVLLLSGGVSVGAYDVVKAVLVARGGIRFSSVRMQPGKPQGFGHWRSGTDGTETPVFALPGNPVSAFVSFEVFVRPALRAMQGFTQLQRPHVTAIAHAGWASPAGRRQFMPVTILPVTTEPVTDAVGPLRVRPAAAGGSGSHLVTGLASADALAIIDESVTQVRVGDAITVMLVES